MKKKTPKPLRRCLSLLLAAAISITAQAMPVTAETAEEISETAEMEGIAEEAEEISGITETEGTAETTEAEEISEATEEIPKGTEETTEITGTEETTEITGTEEIAEITETDAIQPLSIAGGSPANPVHHCAKNDTTDWSYVYFGSYPQTEVTGDALTTAIADAPYDGNGDAWVDGTKYRRISKSDTNNSGYFGNAQYRYFKWERIKWRVLQNDGSTLFLAADKGLDCKYYNDTYTSITWENCTLRSWLNSEFYGTAFSSSEQGAIVAQDVGNEDNPEYNTEGGNDTRDNVYLLSIGEATNPEYGFCEEYGTSSASRRVQASDYAHARGGYKGNGWWWLRSPGNNTDIAANVDTNGYVNRDGIFVKNDYFVCVPALHINLSSDFCSLANPVHHCLKGDTTDWSCIYFGSYPQAEVTGDALTSAIIGAPYDGNGDAWVDGTKYRRISKSDTNNSGYFGDAQYRYFKWERIKWRVLQNDGSTLFLAADKGLDCKYYNDTYTSITWENCTLRSWLNSEFYGTAFSSSEQGAIVAQDVGNEDNPEYNTEGGNDTRDNVYLLSIGEATNPEYGFCEEYGTSSASRRVQASDYAHARGGYKGNGWWCLRSPGHDTSNAAYVTFNGNVHRYGSIVDSSNGVCVPALHINLSSDLWSMADDGTSGEGGNGGTSGEGGNGGFKHEHTWNAGEETAKATCTTKGTKTYTCTSCGGTKTEEIPATGHQHTEVRNKKNSTCAETGYTGDKYCMDCKKIIEAGKTLGKAAHQYKTTVTAKATPSKDGSMVKKCTVCGETAENIAIARIQSVKLGKTKYVYNKKAQKPAVTIKDYKGKRIASKYYTVTYKNNKKVGKAAVTIRFKGNYEGTVTKTFQIVPKPTNITKVAATAKGFQVAWKKQPESTTGYQIQYSTSKKFTKKTTKAKTVKKTSATKLAVRKLKAKKKYYVRIRTYKTAKGKNYYSNWSKTKTVRTGR